MSAEFIECFKSMIIKELRQSVGLLVELLAVPILRRASARKPNIFLWFFLRGMDDRNVEMQSVIQSSPFGRARYWLHRCESLKMVRYGEAEIFQMCQ